jgi:hypothetical protein
MSPRRWRIGLLVGIVGAAAAALRRLAQGRRIGPAANPPVPTSAALGPDTQPVREPEAPPVGPSPGEAPPAEAAVTTTPVAWVGPEGGACPATHPVKAKLASRIYHVEGMANYGRTVPDRCYADEGAAEADGFRRARR